MGWVVRIALLALTGLGCAGTSSERGWELPAAEEVAEWFGEDIEVAFDGNVLDIRGTMGPDVLRRGGRIWARGGPYFYLFNVHVQQLLIDYPDIAGVRATTLTEAGEEIAVVTLLRSDLNEIRWREALARASLAQREGTDNPRLVERLIRFGEDHTEYRYGELAN